MLNSLKTVIDAELNGQVRNYMFRKNPSQTTVTGYYLDLSMSPGLPSPQYYIGASLTSVQLKQSTDGGLYHGDNTFPYKKYLRGLTLQSISATFLPVVCLRV